MVSWNDAQSLASWLNSSPCPARRSGSMPPWRGRGRRPGRVPATSAPIPMPVTWRLTGRVPANMPEGQAVTTDSPLPPPLGRRPAISGVSRTCWATRASGAAMSMARMPTKTGWIAARPGCAVRIGGRARETQPARPALAFRPPGHQGHLSLQPRAVQGEHHHGLSPGVAALSRPACFAAALQAVQEQAQCNRLACRSMLWISCRGSVVWMWQASATACSATGVQSRAAASEEGAGR